MSTWTFRNAALAGLIVLTGCAGAFPGMAPPDRVVVAGKNVVIAGPPGYCIDPGALRDGSEGAFVLLGDCASIANNPNVPAPPVPAVLTASVSDGSQGGIASQFERLRAYFGTADGRAALARDGNADSVEILDVQPAGQAIFLHARDSGPGTPPGLSADYWRGFFDVRGRIVTITVVGFRDRPLSAPAGLNILRAFADRIARENPDGPEIAG